MTATKTKKRERKAPVGTIAGPCLRTTWRTPDWLLQPVRDYFGGSIPFDLATTRFNPTGAKHWWGVANDALKQGVWPDGFLNPPYGKALRAWLPAIAKHAAPGGGWHGVGGWQGIVLLPCARFEQAYFQEAFVQANALCLIRKRVRFINPTTKQAVSGNPYANMFLGFNVDLEAFGNSFSRVGCVGGLDQMWKHDLSNDPREPS
jgi:hypothetical protein